MRKLETETGYYVNKERTVVGRVIYLPEAADVSLFGWISEEEGNELMESVYGCCDV